LSVAEFELNTYSNNNLDVVQKFNLSNMNLTTNSNQNQALKMYNTMVGCCMGTGGVSLVSLFS